MRTRKFTPIKLVPKAKAIYFSRTIDYPCTITGIAANGRIRIVVRKLHASGKPWECYYNETLYVSPNSIMRL